MPGNLGLIRERLGKLGLEARREEEILRELGEHLQDHIAALESGGMRRDAAAQEALNSVSNWPEFRKQILEAENEEGTMNYRTKVLWLPALFALTMSSGLLALLQYAGLLPHFYWLSTGSSTAYLTHRVGLVLVPPIPLLVLYTPWLIALPVVGAVAAFWSRRAGGKALHRILAALAPSLGWLCFLLISPIISTLIYLLMLSLNLRHGHISFSLINLLAAYLIHLVSWVLGPSILLFLGAAPFLRKPQAQP
jgi:hypothetical protein